MIIEIGCKGSVVGIPYLGYDDEEMGVRHEYVNLRKYPDMLKTLPEPAKWRELHDFLAAVNGPGSVFQTFGCEASGPDPNDAPGWPYRIVSYVQITTADIADATDPRNMYVLAGMFCVRCAKRDSSEPIRTRIEFEKFENHEENIGGYCLTFWTCGYGRTPEESRASWGTGLLVLQEFILDPGSPEY